MKKFPSGKNQDNTIQDDFEAQEESEKLYQKYLSEFEYDYSRPLKYSEKYDDYDDDDDDEDYDYDESYDSEDEIY